MSEAAGVRRLSNAERAALGVAVERTAAAARDAGRTRILAFVVPLASIDSDAGLRVLAWAGSRDRFYWERVDRDDLACAWGSLEELEAEGRERHAAVDAWRRELSLRIDWAGADRPATRPVWFGGFSFEARTSSAPDWKSFPAARFLLPEGIVERDARGGRCVLFGRVEPSASGAGVAAELERRFEEVVRVLAPRAVAAVSSDVDEPRQIEGEAEPDADRGPEYRVRSDRSHARFRAQVRAALAAIASGEVEKLVLARSLAVELDGEFGVPGFLGRLRALYPSCTLVAFGRGRDTFLAATPETLVRVTGDRVESTALAGSAPRGRTPEEDAALARALLESAKERDEHAHVVDAIRAVLAPRCNKLSVPDAPRLRALFGIQHLETPIEGRLAASDDVLSLVEALHPTPAVAGAPVRAASEWLRRHEGLERGWYAAPIGWLDRERGGDFCVGLRSALIREGVETAPGNARDDSTAPGVHGRALLFAGAGVVAGSQPEQELVETRIKLRALLAPLTEI